MIRKQSNVVFIFDFDGVIVDSITTLYETYNNFLQKFDHQGNRNEFDSLNGPNLTFIISYLKKKYNLPLDKQELTTIYKQLLSSLYQQVGLFEGVEEIFDFLKKENYKIAIASSGNNKDITFVLNKFELSQYIDVLITGDDVSKSKPSPEIYLLTKNFFPNHEYFVIEDSKNGLKSAKEAKTNTIFFNPFNRTNEENVVYEIHELIEIKNISQEYQLNCFTLEKTNEISLNLVSHQPNYNNSQKETIETIWKKHSKTKELFDGEIICYKSHVKKNGKVLIDCYISQYKYYFSQLQKPELNLEIYPIGVSGVIIDSNNNTIVGLRNNVTEYKGFYEFVPSGGISSSKIEGGVILHNEQLIEEFLEETKIKMIPKIEPFCFIFDRNNGVYDICSRLLVDQPLENLIVNNQNLEYKTFEILRLKDLSNQIKKNRFVPTSRVMLNNIKSLR